MRRYFYKSLASYLSLYVRPQDEVVEIGPRSESLRKHFTRYRAVASAEDLTTTDPRVRDYVLLNGTIHYERDIQEMLNRLRESLEESVRVLFVYYSMLWKPLARFASKLGVRGVPTNVVVDSDGTVRAFGAARLDELEQAIDELYGR